MEEDRLDEEEELEKKLPPIPDIPQPPAIQSKLPKYPDKGETQEAKDARRMGLAYSLPIMLVAPVLLLTIAGAWLDEKMKTSPWFTLAGVLLGMISGLINMIRTANKLNE